jgi:hypothetical protein
VRFCSAAGHLMLVGSLLHRSGWLVILRSGEIARLGLSETCSGSARVRKGNAALVGRPGGLSGSTAGQILVTAKGAAVIPSQWAASNSTGASPFLFEPRWSALLSQFHYELRRNPKRLQNKLLSAGGIADE